MGLTLVITNQTGTTMSVLRSFICEQWPSIDVYGHLVENETSMIHIASSGLGDPQLYIGIEEWTAGKSELNAEINLTLDQAKLVLEQIQKFVDFHTNRLANND
jgi:hypothetical protein